MGKSGDDVVESSGGATAWATVAERGEGEECAIGCSPLVCPSGCPGVKLSSWVDGHG